jgi:hypothetical protein
MIRRPAQLGEAVIEVLAHQVGPFVAPRAPRYRRSPPATVILEIGAEQTATDAGQHDHADVRIVIGCPYVPPTLARSRTSAVPYSAFITPAG